MTFVTPGRQYGHRTYPPTFRPPEGIRRRPVRGGRWMVRKVWELKTGSGPKQRWQAWNENWAAQPRRKRFDTFDEAIRYAQGRAHGVEHFRLMTENSQRRHELIDAGTES